MRVVLSLLPLALLGCSGNVCDYLGDYTGTFSGDASGTLNVVITDLDGATLVDVTLEGDEFSAIGDGTVDCDTGELLVTLYDDTGAEIGTFDGDMLASAGDWELGTGEAGTWEMAAE